MNREYKMPEILAGLLKENHMTQRQLAKELNISPEAVNKWLRFRDMPSAFSLMAAAEYFDISLDHLVYGE